MAKVTVTTVTNGNNLSNINNNFQLLADSLNDGVLWRDNPIGEPNQMENDLDMNNQDILNTKNITATTLTLNGVDVIPTSVAINNGLLKANNLSDVASIPAARTNLGINNVDNTSDVNKPISTATQTALNLKANLTANTFTAQQTVSYSSPAYKVNDTVGSGTVAYELDSAGVPVWDVRKTSGSAFVIGRYVAGVLTDSPISIANATGVVTFAASPIQPTPATADNSTTSATTAYVVAKLSSPTPIGNTVANTGSFTTLNSTGGALNGSLGATSQAGAQVTTLLSTSDYSRSGAAGTIRSIRFQTALVDRWSWDETSTAEGGSNAGTNFQLSRYADAGTFIDSPITVNRASGTVQIKGTNTNDSAAAGFVGEYVVASVVQGSAVALTTGVAANITSISLTAGDWDVTCVGCTVPAATTTQSNLQIGISTVSATQPSIATGASQISGLVTTVNTQFSLSVPSFRVSLNATTTVFMVATSVFAVSTNAGFGKISARRIR